MKTISISIIVIMLVSTGHLFSQATYEGNDNAFPPNSFIGWDGSVLNDPLQIRHDANQSIQFGTNGNERMRILRYGNIGIGTGASEVGPKLMSFLDNDNASFLESANFESTAIFGHNNYSTVDTEAFSHIGVRGLCDGVNPEEDKRNTAGEFTARYAFQDVGVEAYVGADPMNSELVGRLGWGVRAIATDHSMANIGVSGRATPFPNSPGTFTVGVAGGVDGTGTNMWAGFFEGSGLFVDGTFYPSDESFKENVEPIENALDVIGALNPKSYSYITEGYPSQYFSSGIHHGLIAQELESVLPVLVRDVHRPNELDDPADETITSFKAVNYTGLIPILIAGMKEQQSIIEAQNEALAGVMDQLNALQNQVNNCCNSDATPKNSGTGQEGSPSEKSFGQNELYQNTPNPFRTQTTISYTLEQGGKVLLQVFDKTGKPIATFVEAEQAADTYRYDWDATGLPAGLYHYALYVDGELLVKKAIKLKE